MIQIFLLYFKIGGKKIWNHINLMDVANVTVATAPAGKITVA